MQDIRIILQENWEKLIHNMTIPELEEQVEIFTEAMGKSNQSQYEYNGWLAMRQECRELIKMRKGKEPEQLSLFKDEKSVDTKSGL